MNQLNLYLIRDLTNIVNFYLNLRTINYNKYIVIYPIIKYLDLYLEHDWNSIIKCVKNENINRYNYLNFHKYMSSKFFQIRDDHGINLYIGILNDNTYFGISYNKTRIKGPKVIISLSKNLNNLIEDFLTENQKIKFYEFQNEQIKPISN
jgi:hypothetical protein